MEVPVTSVGFKKVVALGLKPVYKITEPLIELLWLWFPFRLSQCNTTQEHLRPRLDSHPTVLARMNESDFISPSSVTAFTFAPAYRRDG